MVQIKLTYTTCPIASHSSSPETWHGTPSRPCSAPASFHATRPHPHSIPASATCVFLHLIPLPPVDVVQAVFTIQKDLLKSNNKNLQHPRLHPHAHRRLRDVQQGLCAHFWTARNCPGDKQYGKRSNLWFERQTQPLQ